VSKCSRCDPNTAVIWAIAVIWTYHFLEPPQVLAGFFGRISDIRLQPFSFFTSFRGKLWNGVGSTTSLFFGLYLFLVL
jgi:hypothetical protein